MKNIKSQRTTDEVMTDEKFAEVMEPLMNNEVICRLKKYRHHRYTTLYEHCVRVAVKSYRLACFFHINVNLEEMLRGAMLHDLYLYDEYRLKAYKHGIIHAEVARRNAKKYFALTKKEEDIIYSHMWPLNITHIPRSREAFLVSIADKICAIGEYSRNMPVVVQPE